MPLRWTRGENPYRVNYFGILQLGSNASPRQIAFSRENLAKKVSGGGIHRVGDREVSEADLAEAESRLLDRARWAAESLLVHPLPATDHGRLARLCTRIMTAATPPPAAPPLRLTNLAALAALIPEPHASDVTRPAWGELPVPGPGSAEDLRADIQFDL
jgi:hypothetical protein